MMDKYEKIRVIGRGAYGTVHLCQRSSDKKQFIIKEIAVDQMTPDERQTSLNEAKVLSMLDHPNIVAYHENFLYDNTIAIVMEYVEGGTLYDYLQRRVGNLLCEEEAMHLFSQLVLALKYVHSHLILHRDLKSQNILLNKTRTIVKIGDFGISKILSSRSKAVTVVGTPCYISPELCEGKPYNQKSDIWALGCILYELLTLKRPFEGDNLPALVMKIMQGNFDAVPDIYDRNIQQLVMDMLSLDASKRPTTNQIMALPFMVPSLYELYLNFGCMPYKPSIKLTVNQEILDSSFSDEDGIEYSCKVWFLDENAEPVDLPLPSSKCILRSISIGSRQKAGLTYTGHAVVWKKGRNASANYIPFAIEEKFAFDLILVSSGEEFSVCLSKSGVLSVWGFRSSGCLANESAGDILQPKIVESLFGYNVISVACGSVHAVAVTEDHDVFSWGHGERGCLGLGKVSFQVFPKMIEFSDKPKIVRVFCGPDTSFAITKRGVLLACGLNRHNKLALDTEDGLQCDEVREFIPVRSDPLPSLRVKFVSSGMYHTAVITDKGKVYTVGSNRAGQLGWGDTNFSHNMPGHVSALSAYSVAHVACGDTYTLAITEDGHLYGWGKCPKFIRDPDHLPVGRIERASFLNYQKMSYVSCNGCNCAIITKTL